jgi:hypothetical protein
MDSNGSIALRFPLVPRVRPGCLPLTTRVGNLVELADRAEREAYQGMASSVFNQAALLASDLGLPDLARQWCHRHAAAYLRGLPRTGMDAIRGLEPLVNLARLHIRAGHGDEGHRMLVALYEAVTVGAAITLDSITVPPNLTATDADRQEVRQWLWRVVIADGTRALTTAGRWQEALAHLERHHGVGEHMLDGRQVAVLARATANDYEGAQQLIAGTAPGDPWENAVTACLSLLCRPLDSSPTDREITQVLASCHQLDYQENLVVFHTRLVLSIVDMAGPRGHSRVRNEAEELVDRILDLGDGYAAREVLGHDATVALLTEQQMKGLAETVNACALGQGTIPAGLRADLLSALSASEDVILRTLSAQSGGQLSQAET